MKIGQYEVTEVSRDSARVGCQVVTRAEAEALVREMDKAPFLNIERLSDWTRDPDYVSVQLSNRDSGFIAVSQKILSPDSYYNGNSGEGYSWQTARLVLHKDNVKRLIEFLQKQL